MFHPRKAQPTDARDGQFLTLEEIEPYVVATTLLAGMGTIVGVGLGTVPPLVLLTWFLFLVNRQPGSAAPRVGAFACADRRSWGLSVLSLGAGIVLAVGSSLDLRFLSMGWLGARWAELALAFLGVGIPSAVLPPRSPEVRAFPRAWRWVARG